MPSRLPSACTLLLLVSPAARAGNATYMWGIGPRVGTVIIPASYPVSFPSFDELDADGEETGEKIRVLQDTAIEELRGDVILGLEGLYWADARNRLALAAGFGLGSGYRDGHAILKYGRMYGLDALDLFWGGGIGVGRAGFSGEGEELLRVPYYPLRLEGGALFRKGMLGVQALIFLNLNIPGKQELTLADGSAYTSHWGWAFYPQLGVELQVLFGDFTKPRGKADG